MQGGVTPSYCHHLDGFSHMSRRIEVFEKKPEMGASMPWHGTSYSRPVPSSMMTQFSHGPPAMRATRRQSSGAQPLAFSQGRVGERGRGRAPEGRTVGFVGCPAIEGKQGAITPAPQALLLEV
jgi:hypothetical protein